MATDYGHTDMLDEDAAKAAAAFCRSGMADRENMRPSGRRAFDRVFSRALQDDPDAFSVLTAADAAARSNHDGVEVSPFFNFISMAVGGGAAGHTRGSKT